MIRTLIKIETGLRDVSAAAYLAQAEELLAGAAAESDEVTHPEMFIRAKAVAAWHEDPDSADQLIRPLIEGPWQMSDLDLIRQARLTRYTEQFLRRFLRPAWLRTPVVLGHARRFFPDFEWDAQKATEDDSMLPLADAKQWDERLRNYLCYLLLDFCTTDPELEDAPLAAAFLFADQHQLSEDFEDTAQKELRIGKRHFRRIRRQAHEVVMAAEEEFAE